MTRPIAGKAKAESLIAALDLADSMVAARARAMTGLTPP